MGMRGVGAPAMHIAWSSALLLGVRKLEKEIILPTKFGFSCSWLRRVRIPAELIGWLGDSVLSGISMNRSRQRWWGADPATYYTYVARVVRWGHHGTMSTMACGRNGHNGGTQVYSPDNSR